MSSANAKQPELHTLVEAYLDLLLQEGVRGKYRSIYMALNASCKPHCDKNNVGLSVVTAVPRLPREAPRRRPLGGMLGGTYRAGARVSHRGGYWSGRWGCYRKGTRNTVFCPSIRS